MAALWYPLSGALANANERKTAYIDTVVRLYQSTLTDPQPSTTLADYIAAEADYDGYAPITLAAWNTPIFAPGSGYLINSPLAQFTYVDGMTHLTNTIGGAFVVDDNGDLRMVLALQPSEYIGMAINGDGWAIQIADLFPTGFTG